MAGQLRAARGEDLPLALRMRRALVAEHDLGKDDRPRNRILARVCAAGVHRRMRVQHGFDLLGMDLCAADIDHTASSADKVQSSVALLDLIAGVDEAVAIGDGKRSRAQKAQSAPIRPHAQSTIDDPQLDGFVTFQPRCRKAGLPVIDREDDASFRRSIGVSDPRPRIERP